MLNDRLSLLWPANITSTSWINISSMSKLPAPHTVIIGDLAYCKHQSVIKYYYCYCDICTYLISLTSISAPLTITITISSSPTYAFIYIYMHLYTYMERVECILHCRSWLTKHTVSTIKRLHRYHQGTKRRLHDSQWLYVLWFDMNLNLNLNLN